MKLLTSLAGGLAGALTVTLLHEFIRKVDNGAPRLDKLGEQTTAKLLKAAGQPVPAKDNLYAASMISDIIGNTIYYSLAGTRMNKAASTGGFLGLGAGLGALKMPQYLNLNKDYTNSTSKRRIITVGLYLTGGLVAAGVMRWLERRKQQRPWKTDHLVATTKSPNEAYKPVLDITV